MKFLLCCCLILFAPCFIQAKVYNVVDYGALGNGKQDDALAIQKAIDACASLGGGTVLLPSGHTFMAGPIELKSNINFEVEPGAILLANPDETVYTQSAFKDNTSEGFMWISAHQVENITLSGQGVIDGNGISFAGKDAGDSFDFKVSTGKDRRPHLLTIIGAQKVRIHDLTIRNSAFWTVHLVGCNDVTISDFTLLNSLKIRNSDGIDLDHCQNVRIVNSHIESGDDCICLKNRREYQSFGDCENVVVDNCTMTSRSCAIKLGTENVNAIRNVLITNCIITKSNRGIGIQNRDEGTISDVVFSNIIVESQLFSDTWWGKAEPIYVTAYPRADIKEGTHSWRFPRGEYRGRVGAVTNISFDNIHCRGENGVYVSGASADKVSNISLRNVDVFVNKTTDLQGGIYDRRPCNVEGLVKGNTSGFYFNQATNVKMYNCSLHWGENRPSYFSKAIYIQNVKNFSNINFEGEDLR